MRIVLSARSPADSAGTAACHTAWRARRTPSERPPSPCHRHRLLGRADRRRTRLPRPHGQRSLNEIRQKDNMKEIHHSTNLK